MNKNFKAYHDELREWISNGNEYSYDAMAVAFYGNFLLVAVDLWTSTGASNLDLPLKISKKKLKEENDQFLDWSECLICKDCNAHSFYDPDDFQDDFDKCSQCFSENVVDRKEEILKEKLLDLVG